MIFLVSIPLWLWLILWLLTAPGRARARRLAAQEAATTRELQIVAAMTEDMKAEYWARKHAEAVAAYRPLMSNAKAARRMALAFFLIIAAVITIGIMTGGN
jgi:hypothetical protein